MAIFTTHRTWRTKVPTLRMQLHSLWYTTFDGSNWTPDASVPHVSLNASPTMAVFNKTLYLAHQGSDSTGEGRNTLVHRVPDGTKWLADKPVPDVHLTGSPSMVFHNEKLYFAYVN